MAHSHVFDQYWNDRTDNPYSGTFTPMATITVFIIHIVVEGTTPRAGGAPTFKGLTMSQADETRIAGGCCSELWYICGRWTNAAHGYSIPNTNANVMQIHLSSAVCADGYDSVYQGSSGNANTTNSDGWSINLTSDAVGDYMYARVGVDEGTLASVSETSSNPTKVEINAIDHGAYVDKAYYGISDGAGTETFTFAWSSDTGCGNAVVFKSVESGSAFEDYPADDVGLSDALAASTPLKGRTPAEIAGITDALTRIMAVMRLPSENAGVTDYAKIFQTFQTDWEITPYEMMGISDSLRVLHELAEGNFPAEIFEMFDYPARSVGYARLIE